MSRIGMRQIYSWTLTSQSKIAFGNNFATQVARKFWANESKVDHVGVIYLHRDYCGHSLVWLGGNLQIGKTYDGCVTSSTKKWRDDEMSTFIEWLAKQSDYSLSGHDESSKEFFEPETFYRGNQRINLNRLSEFLRN